MHWGTGVLPRNGVPLWGKASDANNTNSATNEKKLKKEVSLWQVMQQVQLQLYEIKDEKWWMMVDIMWKYIFPLPASEQILDFCKKNNYWWL